MDVCKTCHYYQKGFLFVRSPTCTRISNVEIKTKKNTPFKINEAYKICKGYFYECSGSDTSFSHDSTSDDGHSGR